MAHKVIRNLHRADGSEVRIVGQRIYRPNCTFEVDIYVLRRETSQHDWACLSKIPKPGWREMSVDEYIKHGRSPMLQAVTHGEIFSVANEVRAH